ncbi:PglL family O-oligosaccharyltransferase [Snodgrassella sp. CFCC 13594]|uniref:PglL family O-oligosaccharyltransferase n=1 Tax=Snodgrassella sp. CFCC 13594 TaxID=1775559 RepID=UPI0009ED2250|nr:Wzy polymerase domain-containing protein [Snodgrassella sp. CFCC 13594]
MIRDYVTSSATWRNRLPECGIWWLGMLLVCVVPFLSSARMGTLSSFYLENGTLFFAAALALATALTQFQRTGWPRVAVVLLVWAVLLMVQARIMRLPYVSQSDLTAAIFLILALLAWAARAWVLRVGQRQAVAVLAWALLIGAVLQSVVCILQFSGEAAAIPGVLPGPGNHYVYGQLAQRNHLGHYLMWGVLAVCYLWHERKLEGSLAVVLMLWLTGVMGLVGSRTIIAYVLAVGVSLGFWRWRAGAEANRLLGIIAIAIACILFFQLTLSPMLSFWLHIDFQSATERLGEGSFAQSGRQMEWRKAWAVFMSAPLWGHGWGSYAYQGFAQTGIYSHGFREYEGSVLFTHCHNLILQLLAETGVVGVLLVVAGFVWSTWTLFQRGFHPASIILVSMMLVSLCHSMLEYPLWYVYFLAVFVLFMALSPVPEPSQQNAVMPMSLWSRRLLVLLCGIALLDMIRLTVTYTELLSARRGSAATMNVDQANEFQALRRHMYLLRYYVDMAIIEKIDTNQSPLPVWGFQAADLAGLYRPYSNTFVRGLYLGNAGQTAAAQTWITQMAHYYPTLTPSFMAKASLQPQAQLWLPILQQNCDQYQRQVKSTLVCRL